MDCRTTLMTEFTKHELVLSSDVSLVQIQIQRWWQLLWQGKTLSSTTQPSVSSVSRFLEEKSSGSKKELTLWKKMKLLQFLWKSSFPRLLTKFCNLKPDHRNCFKWRAIWNLPFSMMSCPEIWWIINCIGRRIMLQNNQTRKKTFLLKQVLEYDP